MAEAERSDRRTRPARPLVVAIAIGLLVVAVVGSLSLGSNPIPVHRVWELLAHSDGSQEAVVVRELRLPRTVVAMAVGAALGLAGALMQALTRNPLADPGLLGVNAGASLAVVLAVAVTGVTGILFYLWFALAGAAVAALGVYLLAGTGRQAATPARLALAGVAMSAALTASTQTVVLADQQAFNEFRFWVAGSLEGRGWSVLAAVGPVLAAGLVIAMLIGPALNAMAFGDETGKALGVRVARTRALTMAAVVLLCGAATAAVGPILFVGLAIPMVARSLVGHDHRWVAGVCLVLGPVWVLAADTAARIVLAPEEIQVGVMAALLGGPVFIAVVRRRKVAAL